MYHGSGQRFEAEKGNALLVRKSGATYEFVEASQIGPAMDYGMNSSGSRRPEADVYSWRRA